MTFTEVIKVEDGKFCNLSAHLKRLRHTANHFFGSDIDVASISESAIPSELQKGVVKCRIVYSDHILSVNFQPYTYRNIKKLALVYDSEIDYSYKYQDRSRLDHLLEQRGDADEILIVKSGLITDTSFTNVVFRDNNGSFFTPDSYLLAGTKRQQLLDTGIIGQRRITIDDIAQYSAIYLINAMINIDDEVVADIPTVCR